MLVQSISSCEPIRIEIDPGIHEIVGLNLGFSEALEHQGDVKWRTEYFGVAPEIDWENYGLKPRTNTGVNCNLELVEAANGDLWLRASTDTIPLEDYFNEKFPQPTGIMILLGHLVGADLRAAWGSHLADGFIVVGQSTEGKQAVRLIHHAIKTNRCVISKQMEYIGRGSLVFIAADRLPVQFAENQCELDKNALMLRDAATETGIVEKLQNAAKFYYTLSPAWANKDRTEVHFYLQPHDRKNCRNGWYNVRQLEEWINDDGPVMIKNKFDPNEDGRQ